MYVCMYIYVYTHTHTVTHTHTHAGTHTHTYTHTHRQTDRHTHTHTHTHNPMEVTPSNPSDITVTMCAQHIQICYSIMRSNTGLPNHFAPGEGPPPVSTRFRSRAGKRTTVTLRQQTLKVIFKTSFCRWQHVSVYYGWWQHIAVNVKSRYGNNDQIGTLTLTSRHASDGRSMATRTRMVVMMMFTFTETLVI